MLRLLLFSLLIGNVLSDDGNRVVSLDDGIVKGSKYWDGDFYEFYGIPYATAPTGRDRFKAPLPVTPWEGILEANIKDVLCPQIFLTNNENDEIETYGEEDCLRLNLLVPEIASEENLVPVVFYIHSGAFAGGNSNMGRFHYVARHDVLTVSANYRLGVIGFACLGTEEIPGNAGLKDQLAALRWINKNIKKFGGDPTKVTIAGFSVGASMAELLALSKAAEGLFDKLILDSGSSLAPFAVNRDPINTARNLAISLGFNDTGNIKDLSEFLLAGSSADFAAKSLNFFLKNSTFGFAPCIETVFKNSEPILTEHPLVTLSRSEYQKVPVLIGFSNMEGLSRSIKFDKWSEEMNEKFEDFLPADLEIKNKADRNSFIKTVFDKYFKGEEVTHDTVQGYIDYFSDSMFKYSIMKSAKLHAVNSVKPVFLYEFTYVGELNMKHMFMDRLKGASHRDQTSYIIDFYGYTHKFEDLDTRDRLTAMWTDFIKYENPTAYESSLVNVQWLKYSVKEQNYMEIGNELIMKRNLFADKFSFWDKAYSMYGWKAAPTSTDQSAKTKK